MLAPLADLTRRVLEQLSLAWPCTYRLLQAGKKYFPGKEHSERSIFHVNRREQRKEQAMYTAIRWMKAKPGELDEAIQRIENGFVPLVSSMPGFIEYYVMQVGEDEGLPGNRILSGPCFI
jgi:hypothetical protein